MKRQQVAIASVSTQQSSLDEALSAYADAGFARVEFSLTHVKDWLGASRSAGDLKAQLDRLGLTCVGGFEAPLLCFAADREQRDNVELHVANAELLSELGGGTLVVGTDGPAGDPCAAAAVPTIGRALRQLAERMPESVRLAVEFNWSPFIRSLKSAVAVAQAAEHPRVGVLFDTAHYHCTPTKFEDLTDRAIGLIGHVHVNDMPDKGGDVTDCNEDRLLPGAGVLDLARIIGRLEAGGYLGTFSIEMFSADLRALPAAVAAQRCHAAMMSLCQD